MDTVTHHRITKSCKWKKLQGLISTLCLGQELYTIITNTQVVCFFGTEYCSEFDIITHIVSHYIKILEIGDCDLNQFRRDLL